MSRVSPKRRVYGVDFSGSKNAGNKIWIAGGTIDGSTLKIDDCQRAENLQGWGRERDRCLTTLRDFIARERDAAFGLDFPFGLSHALLCGDDWEKFVRKFPMQYKSPEQFRQRCYEAAGGVELKRRTDLDNQTPFCAYNLRLFRQTYFGIRDVLYKKI